MRDPESRVRKLTKSTTGPGFGLSTLCEPDDSNRARSGILGASENGLCPP